jgi:acyl-CoA thioesterase I
MPTILSAPVACFRYGARRAIRNLVCTLLLLPSVAFADAPLRVVALGDSLTQGYGLPEDEGFVPQLQRWLEAQGRAVQVVNAGVSGDTSAGGASRVEWSLAEGADAMIVTLGGNDLLRGLDPALTRANLDRILTVAAAQGVEVLLMAMEAPGNYGPDYQRDFDAIYADLAAQHGVLLGESFLKPLMRGESDISVMRDMMQADGIHPNAEGVGKIVAGMGPRVLDLLDRVTQR